MTKGTSRKRPPEMKRLSGRLREMVVYKNLTRLDSCKRSPPVVAVSDRRWSFTRGSNCKALTVKILVFWIGGCLWEVVVRGGSTVRQVQT